MKYKLNRLYTNLEYLKSKSLIDLPANTLKAYTTGHQKLGIKKLLKLSEACGISIDHLLIKNLKAADKAKNANIRLLVMDVDGVLTDGGMYLTENGDEIKRFNAKDGMAIKRYQKHGKQTAIISNGRRKNAIEHRAEMLGIERVYVGKDLKLDILNSWLEEMNIGLNEVAYIGDDINDLPVMEKVAFSACPSNAAPDVLNYADVILSRKGGDACVRELIENYLLESLDI